MGCVFYVGKIAFCVGAIAFFVLEKKICKKSYLSMVLKMCVAIWEKGVIIAHINALAAML
jgi:hypothetical protein